MLEVIFLIILIFILLLTQFMFAGSEMSIISCDKLKMHALANDGNKGAAYVLYFHDNPQKLFSTTLVGVNLAVVMNSTILTSYLGKILSGTKFASYQSYISLAILWPLVLLFGEVIPMGTFRKYADVLAPYMSRFLYVSYYLLYPFTYIASLIIKKIYDILNIEDSSRGLEISKDEFHVLLSQSKEVLSPEEQNVITHLFSFEKITVSDVMVPLVEVQMVSYKAKVKDVLEIVKKYGHSRIPVYKDRIDQIIGILHVSSLLNANIDEEIKDYDKNPMFVPETAPAQKILSQMRNKNIEMAIVVDEFGGVQGIVTVENIIEEILGEIDDEYDKPSQKVKVINENLIVVDGKTSLKTLQEKYNINIQSNEVETIAGFILSLLGYIPSKNITIPYDKYLFRILDSSERKINKIEIRILDEKEIH